MSFPFYAQYFTFTQPDGTKLPVIGWGDQHHATFETIDGYTVVENPVSGYYEYARSQNNELIASGVLPNTINPSFAGISKNLRDSKEAVKSKVFSNFGLPPSNARWKQRREEAKNELLSRVLSKEIMPAPPQRQTVGNYIGLCLLIDFPDVPATIPANEVEDFCNKKGYSGYGNNGSVYDYYSDNSNRKLFYTNIVAPYYTAKNPRAYYTNESVKQPIRTIELIQEALTYHLAQGFNFSGLTTDTKNYVFALNVFYAGDVVNNWSKGLWPHSYNLNAPFQVAPNKFIFDYQITNIGNELTLATFCHENGHMICNFPDLYDYGYESRGVGFYCLMCAGGNASPKNPVQIGAYLKFKVGWADQITNIVSGLSETIDASRNVFFLLRKNVTEYFIIENRNQINRDTALPDSGLAIWLVDELGDNSKEQMTPSSHYECSLIQADGKNDLENGTNDGDNTDLFHSNNYPAFGRHTKPASKWWDGSYSGLELYNISTAGNQISFSTK